MKITCDRKLGFEELKELKAHAKFMMALGLTKDWTGDGMLYLHAGTSNSFKFIDQKYVGEKS